MKAFLTCFGFLVLLPGLTARAEAADAIVTVDTGTVIVQSYTGAGVQWDPSDATDYTNAQWRRIYHRVDFLKPQFIRCCLVPSFYCNGMDAQGNPVYDWNSLLMQRLYHILDYCQARHVPVLLGEWGPSFGIPIDDPRWSRMIGDCLDELVKTRGYTCIQFYNKQNEPRGDHAYFEQWKTGQLSLQEELTRRGLNGRVVQVGPDVSGADMFGWVEDTATELPQAMGVYEVHWYAGDDQIRNGVIETTLRQKREFVTTHDPHGAGKPFWVAEAGTADSRGAQTGDWANGDSNQLIHDFRYGVLMSDYLAQTMRAGIGGVSAWDLDDSMHPQAKIAPTPENPHAFNFKVWGFWNSVGSQMGQPDEENIRPWFYPWSLLCRSFPRGAKIVGTSDTHLPGVRTVAAMIPGNGGQPDLSIAVVNDSDTAHVVHVHVPSMAHPASLVQFDDFQADRPVDADGFPVARKVWAPADLRTGIDVSLPSQGVVILTTLPSAFPEVMARHVRLPAFSVKVHSAEGVSEVGMGGRLQMVAALEPEDDPVRWSVRSPDGSLTTSATITQGGWLTAQKAGIVKVIAQAFSNATPGVKGEALVSIVSGKLLIDNVNDWTKVFSHSPAWQFDTANAPLFEGQPSRLKRISDTPENVVYRFAGLADFAAKIYFTADIAGKVTFSSSPDAVAWTPIEVTHDAPIPTGWEFYRVNFRPMSIPAGTNYLRIEFAHDPDIFSPQLAQVRLYSVPNAQPAFAIPKPSP